MKAALHLLIKGRVQGVGYRYYAQHSAAALGITGYVRNQPDGAVEIVAEGDEEALNELVNVLRKGPSFAFVEDVEVRKMPAEGTFTHFGVKY
jgi:acylphosphatase